MPDTTSETVLYPESIAAFLDQRPDPPSIIQSAYARVIDARLAELRANTERYERALGVQIDAEIAAPADSDHEARRIEAEGEVRQATVRHEALLAEIAALTALLGR